MSDKKVERWEVRKHPREELFAVFAYGRFICETIFQAHANRIARLPGLENEHANLLAFVRWVATIGQRSITGETLSGLEAMANKLLAEMGVE